MAGKFKFLRNKFPEIAQDGEKAESYLYTDNAACMLYISRVFDNVVKELCRANNIGLKSDGQDRTLAELIDELARRKIVHGRRLGLMHKIRIFRNKNAHNQDTSQNDNIQLLKQVRTLCVWLVRNQTPEDTSRISIIDIMSSFKRNPVLARNKYEGRTLTLTGGKVLKVTPMGNEFSVSLVSSPADNTVYRVDCVFPARMEPQIRTLKPGQFFTATGTWRGRNLMDCVWDSGRPQKTRQRSRRWTWRDRLAPIYIILFIIMAIIFLIEWLKGGGL